MADFRPFRGWRYNPDVVGDLASVLCPPFDIIAPELQESLSRLSPYNAVHLEGGEMPTWDTLDDSSYPQAAALFKDWLRQGVLQREPEPCFYLLRQGFQFQGQARARLGLFGCMRLEEYERWLVLPHEYTKEPAIQARLSLMEACSANFSPIMGLYRDSPGLLSQVFNQVMNGKPTLRIEYDREQDFTLWRVTDSGMQEQIDKSFAGRAVYLADGHHRYEAALRFRQECLRREKEAAQPTAAYNFVMMGLIEFDDPGLVVLPYHRVLGNLPASTLTKLKERLHQLFEFQPILSGADRGGEGLLEQMARCGQERQVVGLTGPEDEGTYLLTLREEAHRDSWGPLAVSEAWILEEQVLKLVLGSGLNEHLTYIHDHDLALERVASGQQQMAFLFNPFSMALFEAVVGEGTRLPPKSTFFFPKLPTGLVFNQLDGTL